MSNSQNNSNQYSNVDSFFTRVFGHSSSHESSRAGSPTAHLAAAAPKPSKTISSSTVQTSRHNRNSSAGTIPSPEALSVPALPALQRRRSFDGHESRRLAAAASPLPDRPERIITPTASVSTSTTPNNNNKSHAERKRNPVQYPRGGRHIGESPAIEMPYPLNLLAADPSDSSRQHAAGRRNSGEPSKHKPTVGGGNAHTAAPPTKKRNFLGRFGKKKSGHSGDSSPSRTPLPSRDEVDGSFSSSNQSSSSTLNSSPYPSINSTASLNHSRKVINDDMYRFIPAHPLDLPAAEVNWRSDYDVGNNNGRKKSSGSGRRGKDREKSEGHAYVPGEIRQLKEIELDQNFGSMDGIVNPDFMIAPIARLTNEMWESSAAAEQWAPPDSWAVQLPGAVDSVTGSMAASALVEEESQGFDEYVDDQEKWDMLRKNFRIRIFRPDATFGTLQVPLNTTTAELLHKLAGKFFLADTSKYNLVIQRNNTERVLQPHERPLQIQKMLFEQMGYTEQDRVEDIGLEDNTYLVRFVFRPNVAQMIPEDPELASSHNIDLKGRNLSTIPIFLYKRAAGIVSLDLSRNLLMEIPVDFAQMCKALKQLSLADNEYANIPTSVRHIRCLEYLDVSGNRLRDLQHAHLDELKELRTLRAYNNRLESLPASFENFSQLTVLLISNNSFTVFPDVICQITTLAYLDISFNKITAFPDEIGNLTRLVRLYAIGNRLAGPLPQSFSKLEKLQKLDVRQNLLTELDVLSSLPNLETVLADYNAMSAVNCDLRNVRQLELYKNRLTHFNISCKAEESSPAIPQSPSQGPSSALCNLADLNLSNCKLSSLPDELFRTATLLEKIVLDGNTLTALPSTIGCLRKLTRLSVQANHLESLPAEIAHLTELKHLDVQKNNLKTLPKEIWLCASLQTLNCSSNLLESFPQPYAAPGVALHLPLTPQRGDVVVTPSVAAAASPSGDSPLSSPHNVGQGIVVPADNATAFKPTASNSTSQESSSVPMTPQAAPNFNPPSFFASPRNHPPPLSLSLRQLFMGDNRLTDEVWSPLSWFMELRTLNLSFNYLTEMLPEGFFHQHLYELYLSGNHLTSLPADDIEKLSYLRVLAVNGNKLQTLPAEIGKLRKLLVLDVGNNMLKYNISNWPYDWNWNWNLGLKYLNLSGNKRLEIKKTHPDMHNRKDKDLSDFSALTRLRTLGLMDITILGVSVLEEFHDRRVRTSPSEVNSMAYGIADWLGPNDHLTTWDLVMPRFRNKDDECIFGLFDGHKQSKAGCKLTKYLYDSFTYYFMNELRSNRQDDTIVCAMRRTFLALEKGIASAVDERDSGASVVVCYIVGQTLHVANVGDAEAVISRNNGQAFEITQKHIPLNPSETSRIRAAGGFVSNEGRLNGELQVSRSFGHFHLIPAVNANPYVTSINLTEEDEYVIMASRGLWEHMSYQTAVDIARTEKDDMMAAAQKLRDFAITYGAEENIMVMVIAVGDLYEKRDKRLRCLRGMNAATGRGPAAVPGMMVDDAVVGKYKWRGKDDALGDSTLARLDREVPPPINQVALVFTDIKSSTYFWETQPENMRSAIKIHDAVMRRALRSVGGYEVKTEGDAFMVCFQSITGALLWCFQVQLQLLEADWPAGILDTEDGREIEKDNVVIYKGLSVRMGIHWGTPVFERNPITNRMDYFGPVVNKASRICNAADGGQICVSSDVVAALRNFPGVFEDDDEGANGGSMDDLEVSSSSAMGNSGSSAYGHSVSREIMQLKRLGFHVMELGERRLKGLETPEMLSLVYPKQLAGRMELDKSEMIAARAAAVSGLKATPTPPAMMDGKSPDTSVAAATAADSEDIKPAVTGPRTIDPALVCALSNLAIRLERITAGNVLSHARAGSSIHSKYTSSGMDGNPSAIVTTATTGLGKWLDRHMKTEASDEELMMLMENFVARVENAASTLYLHKVGRFANVLEKLGQAIELDPMHILRALQMYSDVTRLSSNM